MNFPLWGKNKRFLAYLVAELERTERRAERAERLVRRAYSEGWWSERADDEEIAWQESMARALLEGER